MISLEQATNEIKRMIDDDPTISDRRHILVVPRKRGALFFKKEEIHLTGTVQSEVDKRKAEEIARHSAAGREILNEIDVGEKS